MQSVTAPHPAVAEVHRESMRGSDKQVNYWIFNPVVDFWAIHGGAGMLVLPLALFGLFALDSWYTMLMSVYSLSIGFPHVVATHVRLNMDDDCRLRFKWLSWQAPLAIMALVAVVVYVFKLLPYLVFVWFALQTWHANRQNYGIMRRYMRMANSDPSRLVNKTAGALIELFPWAAVLSACMWQDTRYQGYPIVFPALQWLEPLCVPVWSASLLLAVTYVLCELREGCSRRAVPGRILCCVSGCVINVLAWIVADDLSWGYLVVSLWHSLQYVAYVQAFRSRPPAGSTPQVKLSPLKHLGLLILIGAVLSALFHGISYFVPALFAVVHLSMNFHHYLSDTLIWRRPVNKTA